MIPDDFRRDDLQKIPGPDVPRNMSASYVLLQFGSQNSKAVDRHLVSSAPPAQIAQTFYVGSFTNFMSGASHGRI